MAFSYPLTIPSSPKPSNHIMRLVRAQSSNESPFTLTRTIFSSSGERWEIELEYPRMSHQQAQSWISFLLQMRGLEGTCYLSDPDGDGFGSPSGSPTIKTINANKRQIVAQSFPTSTNDLLKVGDYFQVGNELKRVVGEDVDSDGSGEANISFQPRIRDGSLAAGSPITYLSPKGIFMLKDSKVEWSSNHLKRYGFKLSLVEVIS